MTATIGITIATITIIGAITTITLPHLLPPTHTRPCPHHTTHWAHVGVSATTPPCHTP